LKDVRIGIIGCGGMGTHLARSCLQVHNAKIVGTYDAVKEKAKFLAHQLKCDYYDSFEDLLDKPDIDAVIVATPNYTHSAFTIAALKAGKHVFCEKPMALKLEDCDAMIGASEKQGLTLMIGHVMRFYHGCAFIKRALENGEIGQPIISHVFRTTWVKVGAWSKSWRCKKELCGNSLFEVAIHDIDLMRWFIGDVKSVKAYSSNFSHPEFDYDDSIIAILRFKNGALGLLESGFSSRLGDHKIDVNGTLGAANIDFKALTVKVAVEGRGERKEPLIKSNPVVDELQHFVNCVLTGKKPITDGLAGRGAVEIALAISRACEEAAQMNG